MDVFYPRRQERLVFKLLKSSESRTPNAASECDGDISALGVGGGFRVGRQSATLSPDKSNQGGMGCCLGFFVHLLSMLRSVKLSHGIKAWNKL